MEIKRCLQCGGNLKRVRTQNIWVCPYCEAVHHDETEEKENNAVNYFGLNHEVFEVKKDLSKIMKNRAGAGCIQSIIHCMKTYGTAKQVEEYMLKKLTFSDDISVKGVREEQIINAMPFIKPAMDPDERVIVYGNKGIFSKGKEYFVITDKRSIFVRKKNLKSVSHVDIDTIKIEDCANCYINDDYDKGLVNLDGKGTFQGAAIALICLFSFEADENRDRIQIV